MKEGGLRPSPLSLWNLPGLLTLRSHPTPSVWHSTPYRKSTLPISRASQATPVYAMAMSLVHVPSLGHPSQPLHWSFCCALASPAVCSLHGSWKDLEVQINCPVTSLAHLE